MIEYLYHDESLITNAYCFQAIWALLSYVGRDTILWWAPTSSSRRWKQHRGGAAALPLVKVTSAYLYFEIFSRATSMAATAVPGNGYRFWIWGQVWITLLVTSAAWQANTFLSSGVGRPHAVAQGPFDAAADRAQSWGRWSTPAKDRGFNPWDVVDERGMILVINRGDNVT